MKAAEPRQKQQRRLRIISRIQDGVLAVAVVFVLILLLEWVLILLAGSVF